MTNKKISRIPKNASLSRKSEDANVYLILIGISTGKDSEFQKTDFYLQENMFDDLIADVKKICVSDKDKEESKVIYPQKENGHKWNSCYVPFSRIHYISADRLGPLKYHDKLSIDEVLNPENVCFPNLYVK